MFVYIYALYADLFLSNFFFFLQILADKWQTFWCLSICPTYDAGTIYTINVTKGINNSINEFRSAATHLSRRLCFLSVYASWSHQSMTALSRFDPSNEYKVVLFADFRKFPHQIPVLPEYFTPNERLGQVSTAAEY